MTRIRILFAESNGRSYGWACVPNRSMLRVPRTLVVFHGSNLEPPGYMMDVVFTNEERTKRYYYSRVRLDYIGNRVRTVYRRRF